MSKRRRRKPGRLYWLWSFLVGVYSPSKGQRRIDADRVRDKERIAELEQDNENLQARLENRDQARNEREAQLVAENNDLRNRLEMHGGIQELNAVRAAAARAASEAARGLSGTIPLRQTPSWASTDPGVIRNRPTDRSTNLSA